MIAIKSFIKGFGWPRIIIAAFLFLLFAVGPFVGVPIDSSLNDVIVRFGMNGILVLSMVPMVQSGCGLNFGIPVGLIAGLLGAVLSLELHLTGLAGFSGAVCIAIIMALLLGLGYGLLLNRVKGDEMIIATYVGYSLVFFMNILWVTLPFRNPSSVLGFKGEGLRATISIEEYWFHVLSDFLKIEVTRSFVIPTGMLLFFAFMCVLMWLFFKTKTGTAITAVGSNPEYARAAGISINRMRVISVMVSTVVAAVGIVVYQQSFGFVQLYASPLAFTFPTVAAVLLGGASINKASIANVVIGTILLQGILTMTPSVINSAIQIDASEVVRIIVTNGMIVYALTRKARVN